MLATATQPALSTLTLWLGLAVAAMILVGLATLLWGRLLHRGLLVAVGAAIGFGLGTWLAGGLGVHLLASRAVMAATLAILGLVLARVVWAVLAGALAASLAAGAVMVFYLHVSFAAAEPISGEALADAQMLAEQVARVAWANAGGLAVVAACLAGVGALVAGLLLPRATAIVMTVLIGASLTTGGAAVGVIAFGGPLLWASWMNPYVHNGLCAGLLLVGLLVQTILELRSRRGGAKDAGAGDKKKEAGGKPQ